MCCHPGVVAHRIAGRAPASSRMRVKPRAAADWHTHEGPTSRLCPVRAGAANRVGWGHCARRYRTRGNCPGVIEIRGAEVRRRVAASRAAPAARRVPGGLAKDISTYVRCGLVIINR
jgi:hypothetical protein